MLRRNEIYLISIVFGSILLITLVLISGIESSAPTVAAAATGNLLQNPGFEDDGVGTGDPTGWTSIGDVYADYTEPGGHTGDFRLSHWNANSYVVATTQTVTGLSDGQYIMRVWYKSGGGGVWLQILGLPTVT